MAVTVYDDTGRLLAMRLTDSSGKTELMAFPVPDFSAGQTPDTGVKPYLTVNLLAWLPGYEQIEVTGIQVFPDITTTQELTMIPEEEQPDFWDQTEDINTPSQNL